VPTFFEEGERYRNEGRNELETHETLNFYLEEYKAHSNAFKEKLTLQQLFQIREERGSYSSNRRKRYNRFYFPTFDLDTFFRLHPVTEEEVFQIATLHILGEVEDWWFGHIEHAKVTKYLDLFHKLRKEFDEKKTKMSYK